MEPTQDVIRVRGVNHPIQLPASLTVALEVYNYAVLMLGDGITWPRGAAVVVATCCPSLVPGWKWSPRQADAAAEAALNALMLAGVSPVTMLGMIQRTPKKDGTAPPPGPELLKRLGELLPVFENEAEEAVKNS
jgi:hypothetical protein